MAMTLADVALKRKQLLQAKQVAYETMLAAIEVDNDAARKTAKKSLNDMEERDSTLNQIEGLINAIAATP